MTKKIILILMIIVLSTVSRLYNLEAIPSGFHKDEVSIGLNSYLIWKTGADEYGKTFPSIFRSLDDYKLPVIMYATAPFTGTSLTEFWTRFPTAFAGAITSLLVIMIVNIIMRSIKVGLIAGFLYSILPWSILFSRSSNETVFFVMIFSISVLLLLWYLRSGKVLFLILFSLFIIFCFLTYRASFIFIPSLLIILLLLNKFKVGLSREKIILGMLVLIFYAYYSVFVVGFSRYSNLSLWSSGEFRLNLEEQIREDGTIGVFITRLFHNKILNLLISASERYFGHFDFTYLFFTGDAKSSNNSTPGMGHMLFPDLIFFPVGIYFLFRAKGKVKLFIVAWLFASPIASSASVDSPSALRNLIMSVPAVMAVSYGIYYLNRKFHKPYFPIVIAVLYSFNLAFFWHQFTVHKKVHMPWQRNSGVSQMYKTVVMMKEKYGKVVFGDYPALYAYVAFYSGADPEIFRNAYGLEGKDRSRKILSDVDNKYLLSDVSCPSAGRLKALYVCPGNRVPLRAKIHDVIRFDDGLPAFVIFEFAEIFDTKRNDIHERIEIINDSDSMNGVIIDDSATYYWKS